MQAKAGFENNKFLDIELDIVNKQITALEKKLSILQEFETKNIPKPEDSSSPSLVLDNQNTPIVEPPSKASQKVIDNLVFQQEQLGRTNEEQKIYNALKQAGVDADSAQGQKITELVTAIESQTQARKDLVAAVAAENKLFEEGNKIFEQTRTPLENLQATYANLNDLLDAGAISFETYSRAVVQAAEGFDELQSKGEDTADDLSVFAEQAARNMQDAFADFLFDPFNEGLDGLLDNFLRIIQRMVAEQAAAKIFEGFNMGSETGASGPDGGTGGGSGNFISTAAGFVKDLFSFEGGGFTGAGPRTGGLDGKGGFLAMVHPNESVLDHTKGQSAGGVTVVQNINTPNASSFRKASSQIVTDAKRQLNRR